MREDDEDEVQDLTHCRYNVEDLKAHSEQVTSMLKREGADPRLIAIAEIHNETALMFLTKACYQPKK